MRSTAFKLVPIVCLSTLSVATFADAEIIKDSKAKLDLRNFYMNRDLRDTNAPQSKAEEWAQGYLFRVESGYSEGPVGFGLDLMGFMGMKLDSSHDRFGTGLLKGDSNRNAKDEYSEAGFLAKARWSKTDIKVGTQEPLLPPLVRNDTRLLPQTFRGASLNTRDIKDLNINVARYDRVNYRDSTNNEEMTVKQSGGRNIILGQQKTSDEFVLGGGSYQLNPELTASYYYSELNGIYKQHYGSIVHNLTLGSGQSFKTDLRFARSMDDGSSNIDNDAFGAQFSYKTGGNVFSAAYQQLTGDTGFAQVNGTDNSLVNQSQLGDFGGQNEHSWQFRHDYDFAALGVPGLTIMNRYFIGDHANRIRQGEGRSWERNMILSYVIQSGPLKDVALSWRNGITRSNFNSDVDENRLIITYSVPLW
jgi:feruloyl esterase